MSAGEWTALITQTVQSYCAAAANNQGPGHPEPSWGAPLLGFSRGDDPLYGQLQSAIGPFFWTPLEAFNQQYPELQASAAELTVITWVLPQTAATRADQRREQTYPAARWARSRHFGEAFNCELRLHLATVLQGQGIPALAPERSPLFAYRQSERFGLASNWSERHAAYIAGLGTFGLSDGLITPLGKAVRCGSVVARLQLPVTPRSYDHYQQWCLFHHNGSCGACIRRCPAGAISAAGHDKAACHRYIREVTAGYAREQFGVDATPCGLCQVGIPCEGSNPLASRQP